MRAAIPRDIPASMVRRSVAQVPLSATELRATPRPGDVALMLRVALGEGACSHGRRARS